MPSDSSQFALRIAKALHQDLAQKTGLDYREPRLATAIAVTSKSPGMETVEARNIHTSLAQISLALANSYAQVKRDVQDNNRLSWAGTAHEIRQLLATLLETLAPDDDVQTQSWYKQDPQTRGPTQKQRTRYILQNHGAGSREQEVAEQAAAFDDLIVNLVRSTYSRASDAAHRFKTQREVQRLLRYFEAFAQDLLNLADS